MTKLSPSTGPEKYEWSEDDKARLVKAMETIFPKDDEMKTEKPCSDHPDAPHGFVRNASHSVGHYVCECSGWVPPTLQERLRDGADICYARNIQLDYARVVTEAADRIDALEAEIEMWKATANAVVDFEKVELRKQVAALNKDAERLDHIQVTGSTVEIVNFGQKPVQHSFRVGGLYKAINFDLRLAIDAAMKESK